MQPNILLYCTDQQRFDTISGLGNKFISTPNFDRLIKRGIAFKKAYTQAPVCTPSRASFLTGRYPASHHVHRNGNAYFPEQETLISKMLADNGYQCGLVGKLHLSRSAIRETRPKNDGFHYFKWSQHPNPDYPEGHDYADWIKAKGVDPVELFAKLSGSVGPGVPKEYHQSVWCSDMAIDFISQNKENSWFLAVNPFDPHPPFDPPKEYLDRFDVKSLPYPLFRESDIERQKAFEAIDQQTKKAVNPEKSSGSHDVTKSIDRGDLGSVPPSDYDAKYVKACYYAMIELLDEQFGRIVEELEGSGQLDNTIIIFTSDHGELLGDHGLIYKGCRFFEGLVHVPLVISWPKRFQVNSISNALVELVDLVPTILEAADIEIPYNVQGKSLKSLLAGETSLDAHKTRVICEYNDAIGNCATQDNEGTHGYMYFDGRYKVSIYQNHDIGELYDLENDPGEFDNLWNNPNFSELKAEIMYRALDAYLGTSDAGIYRSHPY